MKKIILFISLIFSLPAYLFILSFNANAEEFSTKIIPSNKLIKLDKPSLTESKIQIHNQTDQNTTYNIYLRPFKASSNLSGEPDYDSKLNAEYSEFFKNVEILDGDKEINEITLNPKQKKDLILSIDTSNSPEAKDYYFTVIFVSNTKLPETQRTVTLNRGGIGSNILLSVGPTSDPEGLISKFEIPTLVNESRISINIEIANLNDYFISPKGNIIIKNLLGHTVKNIEIEPTNILANSNRIIQKTQSSDTNKASNKTFLLGVYKAELNVALTENGPLLKETEYFLALPIREIIIFIALIAITLWLIKSVKRKIKT